MAWAAPLLMVAAPVLPEPRALSFTLHPTFADKFRRRKAASRWTRCSTTCQSGSHSPQEQVKKWPHRPAMFRIRLPHFISFCVPSRIVHHRDNVHLVLGNDVRRRGHRDVHIMAFRMHAWRVAPFDTFPPRMASALSRPLRPAILTV